LKIMKIHRLALIAAAIALAGATIAAAQEPADSTAAPPAGWSFTPSLTYSGSWDDNVLIKGQNDGVVGDFLNLVNPRGTLDFQGRRGKVSAGYGGTFALYRDLSSLNSYDQSAYWSARRLMTKHITLFAGGSLTASPTTEITELVGVPFLRTGSRVSNLRGGIEAQFTKRASLVASYVVDWIDFDRDPTLNIFLRGGHSHGGSTSFKYSLSEIVALTAAYDLQRASVVGNESFTVQNAWAGVEAAVSEMSRVYGSFGIARTAATQLADARTGPAFRAGLEHQFQLGTLEVSYSRSFVPSLGFGGTHQNEDLTSRLRMPLGRRLYTEGVASWRRNEPLTEGELRLKSLWISAALGYAVSPWMRLEGFYGGIRQTIDRPGGRLDRNRLGFQVITATPMRIR
jgi:hypothetical protein